jgi:hypothetical protein
MGGGFWVFVNKAIRFGGIDESPGKSVTEQPLVIQKYFLCI